MNEEQAKSIGKLMVALTGFVDAWEEQSRRVEELRSMVALICVALQHQCTEDEKKIIIEYGQAYWEKTKTGTPAENNPAPSQQHPS